MQHVLTSTATFTIQTDRVMLYYYSLRLPLVQYKKNRLPVHLNASKILVFKPVYFTNVSSTNGTEMELYLSSNICPSGHISGIPNVLILLAMSRFKIFSLARYSMSVFFIRLANVYITSMFATACWCDTVVSFP